MNLVVRRRLAAGALLSSSALVAGLLLAPSSNAAANGLTITPNGALNTEAAKVLTFKGIDADFEFGGTADFTRVGGGQPFRVTLKSDQPPTGTNRTQTATVNFTDMDDGLGKDGPADAGVYNVTATGAAPPGGVPNPLAPGGGTDTCSSCFTVLAAGPVAVSSITPSSIRPGNTGTNVTIAGNNFERGTIVEFLFADGSVDPGITANAPSVDGNGAAETKGITTRTTLKRRAKVDAADAPGSRGIRVTNLDGTSATCSACFFVAGPALTGLSPTSGVNTPGGAPVSVTFTGPNVVDGDARLEFTGNPGSSTKDGLSLTGVKTAPSDGTSITATFDLQNAAPGQYQGVIRDSSTGIVNACEQPACPAFTVIQQNSPPTVTSLDRDPAAAGVQKDQKAGTTAIFDVAGANFSKGVVIKLFNTGTTTAAPKVTVTAVEFVSATLVRATIVTASDATAGDYDVTATLTDGSASAACAKCYTVTTATPSAPPSPSPCPSSASGASSSPSGTASPSATASATRSASPSASAAASPAASASASGSASPSGSSSPGPSSSSCPAPNRQTLTLTTNDTNIPAGSTATLRASGQPNQAYSLQCYSRPSTTYRESRSGSFDSAGSPVTFTISLGRNTRCFLQYATNSAQGQSPSVVINVRTVLSLSTVRTATRTYVFQGRNLPRVAGQLITLYRVDAAGNEIRTSNLVTDDSGIYRVTRKFTGTGTFRFKVRTSQTLNNAAGVSNTISVAVR